jgi:hypothetical protein
MFLHFAPWNILAAGKLATRQVLLPTPEIGGAFLGVLVAERSGGHSLCCSRC